MKMKGTFAYCHTKEALKRMHDGDIIQHCETELYYKHIKDQTYMSYDSFTWKPTDALVEFYPCYEEWRSLSNLHYYKDLDLSTEKDDLRYLTAGGKVLRPDDKRADKTKKRWFINCLLS